MLGRRLLAVLACSGTVALTPTSTGTAAPTAVSVSARVSAAGVEVTASGSSCASTARVAVTRYLFPGAPMLVVDNSMPPEADGTWQTSFPMPAEPALVIAECDGVTSPPIAIAPTDLGYGRSAVSTATPTEIVLEAQSLIDGTEYTIFDRAGVMLGSSPVAGGRASVTMPRSLGGQDVLGLGVALPANTGSTEPFIPRVSEFRLPLAAETTISVTPRVSTIGTNVNADGTCAGTPRLQVVGRTSGWYDVAPVFVDVAPTPGPDHSWHTTFAMPSIPSTAVLTCSDGRVTDTAALVIAPSNGDAQALTIEATDDRTIRVDRPPRSDGPFEAVTGNGVGVPVTEVDGKLALTIEQWSTPVFLLGRVVFGENAEARQVVSVQAWFIDVPGQTGATTSTVVASTTTTAAATGSTLPATGGPSRSTSGSARVASALVLLGIGAVVVGRRARA